MTYRQLVSPNLDIIEQSGLCLQFSRRVFGAPAVEPTAWEAWKRAKYKHQDRNFPKGVSLPVWFDWWGQLPGDSQKHQYGHVAIRHEDGRIYSSPLTGTGRSWFETVDDLTRAFGGGMKYVGWSEDISNVKVIGENTMTRDQAAELALYIRLLEGESVEEANSHSKYDTDHIVADSGYAAAMAKQIYKGQRWQEFSYRAIKYDEDVKKARNGDVSATELKPGLYEVKE